MERKEIIATSAVIGVAVAAVVGFVLYRSQKATSAIQEEGKRRVDEIYQDMDRAMEEHVKEMARIEADRATMTERHQEVMDTLAAAREAGEDLHLAHLEVLSDLANRTITAAEAVERMHALNAKEELVAA
jgi:uncharacterized membrane protein YgaE (UPF0421/DUF939 family)